MFKIILYLLFSFSQVYAADIFENELQPFSSDGCSILRDGTFGKNKKVWQSCCVEHDIAYWQGGNYELKKKADEELSSCIQEKTPIPGFGKLIGFSVKNVGSAKLPFSWRWGYGWKINRGYRDLTASELQQVEYLFSKIPQVIKIKKQPILLQRKTVTENYCLDMALGEILNELNIGKVKYEILEVNKFQRNRSIGLQLKLLTDVCSEPITFDFALKNENACKPGKSQLKALAYIDLMNSNIESQCLK